MIDRVYPVQFYGKAFAICWRGRELPMYFATEREAKQLLWMLQHPERAHAVIAGFMNTAHLGRSFAERFDSLRRVSSRHVSHAEAA